MLETITTMQNLGYDAPDGVYIGSSATSKVGFFGATPVVQQTVTALTTTSSTVASSVSVAVTQIQTLLKNLGLCA